VKTLKLLIKLGKKNVERILLQKKAIIQEISNLENMIENLESDMEKERQKHTNSEYAVFLERFVINTKNKIAKLNGNIKLAKDKLEKIEEELVEAFAEHKRYEIILAAKKREKEKKELLREVKELDEMNILKPKSENT
jgi:flagellar export protein FliJ